MATDLDFEIEELDFEIEYLFNSCESFRVFRSSPEFKWVVENCQDTLKWPQKKFVFSFQIRDGSRITIRDTLRKPIKMYWHEICNFLLETDHRGKYYLDEKEFSGICKYCWKSYPRACSLQGINANAIPIMGEIYLSSLFLHCCVDCEGNILEHYPKVMTNKYFRQ